MELIYKIDFNTTNFYFKHIIDDLIQETKIKATCKMYRGFILLVCEDEAEMIEDFFKVLEQKLPLSIFISNAQVIENFDFDAFTELKEQDVKLNLSLLTNDEINKTINENNIDFTNDIEKIKSGGVSRFETHNGLKDLFLPSTKLREEFEAKGYEVKLLITNVSNISNLVDISQKDLQLLCSIERPLVKLKFKLLQNAKGEFSNTRFIYAKIADDKETLLFTQALKENGIDYLLYVNDEVYQDGLKVTYNEEQNIIIHGDKGLFPKYDYDLKRRVNSSEDYFEEYGSIYKACIAQFNKRLVPTIGAYFSYTSCESAIKINSVEHGEKCIVEVPNVLNNIDKCFEDIKSIDENTSRLIDNYTKKFPKYFEKEFVDTDADGFEAILNLLAYCLGMKDYKQFEDTALMYAGKSGLQIDMKIMQIDGKNYLDYRRIIQSTLSYKMADVENTLLAYSFYESLCDFISDNVTEIQSDFNAKDIILCGDMFANSILLSKLNKKLNTINTLIPKEYPLDY
ncbi:MAG: hypothetical protein HWD90_08195 [Campylobacteraceae bacterium]|nr:hypothetical protein [Campylobacteraceae bacterium]